MRGRAARGLLIHRTPQGAPVPYPTLCKGCFTALATETDFAQTGHIFEDPVSLDATELIPRLQKTGVTALKIEGRQRSRAYVAQVVRAFRAAVRAAVEVAEAGAPMPAGLPAELTEASPPPPAPMPRPGMTMDLTIGPMAFFWTATMVRNFYRDLTASPARQVVIGEWICSKPLPFW